MGSDLSTPARRWARLVAVTLPALILALSVAGIIYQSRSLSRDRRVHPMPGQLVDVGGYKMHIDCMGKGSPTIILESGLGDSYISWQKVQPQIALFTRVCSYDRAGLGYSDFSPQPRTSKSMAEELHTLLQGFGIFGPIVLVGHSLGGYNVRVFASLYRSDVAGMVLVDSSHPEQAKRLPPSARRQRPSRKRAARGGVSGIHHAIRHSSSAWILRQRCCYPRGGVYFQQCARGGR